MVKAAFGDARGCVEIESGGESPRVQKRVARASVSMPRTSATRVGTERSRTVAFFSNASETVGELKNIAGGNWNGARRFSRVSRKRFSPDA